MGRRSSRSEEGAFVLEGLSLLGQAVDAGWEVMEAFVADGTEVPEALSGLPWWRLGPGVAERVTSLETSPGVFGVVADRPRSLPRGADFVVVADRLGDPGNLGTIVRSAEAAGAQAVLLTPGSVDVWNPKALRAAAGSSLRVPVVVGSLESLGAAGLDVIGTSSHHGDDYTTVDLTHPLAVVVGNEAQGLADDAPVDRWVTIPHAGPAESLNVAMAATVLVFEVARQRRGA